MARRPVIKDIDHGYNTFRSNMRELKGPYTKVGIPEGTTGRGDDGEVKDNLAGYVAANEFGTDDGRIPSRPALRQAFDSSQESLKVLRFGIYGQMIAGKLTARQGLAQMGEFMAAKMKNRVLALRTPPNAPSTIARKGSSNPLIASGAYRQSITHKEVMK